MRWQLWYAASIPVCSVAPPGFAFPEGESAQMVAYNDKVHGFLRMTLELKRRTLIGEYFAAYSEQRLKPGCPPCGTASRSI